MNYVLNNKSLKCHKLVNNLLISVWFFCLRAKVNILFEAPSFMTPLTDQPTKVGERATFGATFQGMPMPRTTWLVSNTEITESEKYHIEIAEHETRMTISNVTVEDAKTAYTCQIVNPIGEAKSTAKLILPG